MSKLRLNLQRFRQLARASEGDATGCVHQKFVIALFAQRSETCAQKNQGNSQTAYLSVVGPSTLVIGRWSAESRTSYDFKMSLAIRISLLVAVVAVGLVHVADSIFLTGAGTAGALTLTIPAATATGANAGALALAGGALGGLALGKI